MLCACCQGELYRSLMRVALKKQDEIKLIIQETIVSEEESVLQCAANFQFTGLSVLLPIRNAYRQLFVVFLSYNVCLFSSSDTAG